MKDETVIFMLGVVMGVITTVLVLDAMPGTNMYRYNEAIRECETELPRNQHCVITAVPEEQE